MSTVGRGSSNRCLPALCTAEWRYEGFCGLLRVTLEDGADWLVAVLAPLH